MSLDYERIGRILGAKPVRGVGLGAHFGGFAATSAMAAMAKAKQRVAKSERKRRKNKAKEGARI